MTTPTAFDAAAQKTLATLLLAVQRDINGADEYVGFALDAIKQAFSQYVIDVIDKDNMDMKRFIAALVVQSGGVVTVTNKTLVDLPSKVDFEIRTNTDRSISVVIPQNQALYGTTHKEGEK